MKNAPWVKKALPPRDGAAGGYWYPTAFQSWGDEEQGAINRVLTSGRFTMGAEVAAFEREFAAFHGRQHGIMVNSGSSANLIAVAALFEAGRLKRGDFALVPAIAWSTTYSPLVQHGLDLDLVDVDKTWNADLNTRTSLSPGGLIVMCSILGNPGRLGEWSRIATKMNVPTIEDNCESLGAVYEGDDPRPMTSALCGTFGTLATFSFFWSHQISGIEGGMVLTDDDELADLCRMLRAHGWTRDVRRPASFENEYDFRLMGYNVRPLELHAAIAREQLKKLSAFIAARQRNMNLFRSAVCGTPGVTLPIINGEPSPFGLHFTVDGAKRAPLTAALRARGIDCRLPTGGSFRLHAYGAQWRDQQTPIADSIHCGGLFLGNAPFPIDEKIWAAVDVMRQVLS